MLILCAAPVDHSADPELASIQKKALNEVTYELIRQVTSPTDLLRQQVGNTLKKIINNIDKVNFTVGTFVYLFVYSRGKI